MRKSATNRLFYSELYDFGDIEEIKKGKKEKKGDIDTQDYETYS